MPGTLTQSLSYESHYGRQCCDRRNGRRINSFGADIVKIGIGQAQSAPLGKKPALAIHDYRPLSNAQMRPMFGWACLC